jgi:hypothetical protein
VLWLRLWRLGLLSLYENIPLGGSRFQCEVIVKIYDGEGKAEKQVELVSSDDGLGS